MNGRLPQGVANLRELPASEVAISAITEAELRFGALHSSRPEANRERLEFFLAPLEKLAFDVKAAKEFAAIKQDLTRRGQRIGPMDLLIAACALAAGATLVTNYYGEFSRVSGLSVERWVPE